MICYFITSKHYRYMYLLKVTYLNTQSCHYRFEYGLLQNQGIKLLFNKRYKVMCVHRCSSSPQILCMAACCRYISCCLQKRTVTNQDPEKAPHDIFLSVLCYVFPLFVSKHQMKRLKAKFSFIFWDNDTDHLYYFVPYFGTICINTFVKKRSSPFTRFLW